MDLDGILSLGNSAVSLISGGTDLAQKLRQLVQRGDKGVVSAAEVAELTLDLQNKLIDARFAQMKLLDALGDLKSEMAEMDRRRELQRDYQPVQTVGGALVLAFQPADARVEPAHYICPACAEDGRRSFLQPHGTGKTCHRCNCFFAFEPEDNRAVIVPRRNPFDID